MTDPNRDLKSEIVKRVQDLASLDRTATAVALVDAALTIFAQQFPATLTDDERRKVQESYPPATDELIAERTMSEQGVVFALGAGVQMATIAIDYTPLSHAKPEMDSDFGLSQEVMTPVVQACEDVFSTGQQAGLSVFGTAALMIHLASHKAVEMGVNRMKLARPLLDALGKLFDSGPAMSSEEVDEMLIAKLREQMGISRVEAKRYIKFAKG